MEYIVLGLVLFIAGVALTFIIDHVKAQTAKSHEYAASRPRTSTAKEKQTAKIDDAIFEAKKRELLGTTTVRVGERDDHTAQTMTVQELIAKLEKLKKDL